MATVQRSGNLAAKTIRLENPAAPVKYQVGNLLNLNIENMYILTYIHLQYLSFV